ncbi:YqiA/YcfP family alpha/beta fold hydrolase [Colwellia sp. 1_MG-2023]|uniref:YqiA/YcfP family alpha/beta fold hydrolase n=1 Tax=Colwellia sp. 1_MG-2023 TaxID=3062649 RepID=UPI0026E39794|nr:YqiA/YcfP family alpha/beta fold hydrolase [Colwellia sp. 1_MG-2023]MDO6445567.1 YqiA/YcfP family alpha/beta fold hydrolase [Colwellia sp. 1_MG-2023]
MIKKSMLYIHGFNSSPLSTKAQLTKQYLQDQQIAIDFHCPQLRNNPKQAIEQLEQILQSKPDHQWCLMGSSLGGYFSTYLAEKYQLKAVLINPAVRPFELLVDYLGEQENPYTHEVYQVTEQHMIDLKMQSQEKISKKHYMVMVQTGDEVLDYQQAVEKYQHCQLIVQAGGDHSFINYHRMLPAIMTFLELH